MFYIKGWFQAGDERRITAVDINYMRKKTGLTGTGNKTKTDIAKEINITPVL